MLLLISWTRGDRKNNLQFFIYLKPKKRLFGYTKTTKLHNYEAAQRDAERQTRAAFRGIVTGIQRIAASHRAVDSGKLAVDAMHRNVEFGTGTEFELLDAQTNYYSAVRAYAQARYDYLTNVLTLKQQAGSLSEADLASVDALLVDHAP